MALYLDLNQLFSGELTEIRFDLSVPVDYQELDIRLCSDARFFGDVTDNSGYIEMKATIELDYEASCSRCLAAVRDKLVVPISVPIAAHLQNEDTDDYIIPEAGQIDVTDFVYQNVVTAFPHKFLCREDCKGLCPRCGKNLNDGDCGCKPEVDPRLAGLADFFK